MPPSTGDFVPVQDESPGCFGCLQFDLSERVVRRRLRQAPRARRVTTEQFSQGPGLLLAATPAPDGGGNDVATQEGTRRRVQAELVGHEGQVPDALLTDAATPGRRGHDQGGPSELRTTLPEVALVAGCVRGQIPHLLEGAFCLEEPFRCVFEELLIPTAGKHFSMLQTKRPRDSEPWAGSGPCVTGRHAQCRTIPPVTLRAWPVMNLAFSEQRKWMTSATSSGSQSRPSGVWSM